MHYFIKIIQTVSIYLTTVITQFFIRNKENKRVREVAKSTYKGLTCTILIFQPKRVSSFGCRTFRFFFTRNNVVVTKEFVLLPTAGSPSTAVCAIAITYTATQSCQSLESPAVIFLCGSFSRLFLLLLLPTCEKLAISVWNSFTLQESRTKSPWIQTKTFWWRPITTQWRCFSYAFITTVPT